MFVCVLVMTMIRNLIQNCYDATLFRMILRLGYKVGVDYCTAVLPAHFLYLYGKTLANVTKVFRFLIKIGVGYTDKVNTQSVTPKLTLLEDDTPILRSSSQICGIDA